MRVILIIAFLVYSFNTNAQGHFPVIAMELQTTAVSGNIVNGQPDISDSTVFNVLMKIVVSDTTAITNLQVALKKNVNEQGVIFSKTFGYDVTGTFADGSSYSRNAYEITLRLGDFMGTIDPYAELVVLNNSGNSTDPITYY